MKKNIGLFLSAFLIIVMVSACSASINDQAIPESGRNNDPGINYTDTSDEDDIRQNFTENKKIIKNAWLDIEALNAKDTYSKILNWARACLKKVNLHKKGERDKIMSS